MANKRIIDIWYDVVNEILYDSNGVALRDQSHPRTYFREKSIINLRLLTDNANTPLSRFDGSETFSAAVDSDFDHDTDVMCKTLDANINQSGDWAADSSTQADSTIGEFSIVLDANTATYETKIGVAGELKNTLLELKAYDGADVIAVYRIPIRCFNLVDDDGIAAPTLPEDTVSGVANIGNGTDVVAVTGLGLSTPPVTVLCTVAKPDNDSASDSYNLFATVLTSSITTDGFTAHLSGNTDSADYDLHYLLIF